MAIHQATVSNNTDMSICLQKDLSVNIHEPILNEKKPQIPDKSNQQSSIQVYILKHVASSTCYDDSVTSQERREILVTHALIEAAISRTSSKCVFAEPLKLV